MASIFTYQDEPPRIHSPWSTPGCATPQALPTLESCPIQGADPSAGIVRLEPERQEGPTEYKLHLLLRTRRKYHLAVNSPPALRPQSPSETLAEGPRPQADTAVGPSPSHASEQARQIRLQQLTTQLLWRLQQSSPFHSSSNADLVLPVLPEATPRLGVPERPAKLLPGLEESQGALYEIGVADDGSLVGLLEDELTESLSNLKAMAASLGCITDVLRKITVGVCEVTVPEATSANANSSRKENLWVAEVLVFPDPRGPTDTEVPVVRLDQQRNIPLLDDMASVLETVSTEQLRVTFVGPTNSGKSSLVGTLSTSVLDNGRGKSRLSLLKHRHEIASGITSSVAQELIGYTSDDKMSNPVVNYSTGNVSSWTDIHNLANRLVFISDSPGLPRYAKSTLRSLISWAPSWTFLCVAADDRTGNPDPSVTRASPNEAFPASSDSESLDLSLCHLDLCLRLDLHFMVVITKMDLATKGGLRTVLVKILSVLKAAGRRPMVLSNAPASQSTSESGVLVPEIRSLQANHQSEIDKLVSSMQAADGDKTVPILLTSTVNGLGIGKFHRLLRSLPIPRAFVQKRMPCGQELNHYALFHIDEVFSIPPSRVYSQKSQAQAVNQGIVLCGQVARGTLACGDVLYLGPFSKDQEEPLRRAASQVMPRSKSCSPTSAQRDMHPSMLARSYQGETTGTGTSTPIARFLRVRVVSLRNLRLPVMRMQQGETGTIGIEVVEDQHGSAPLQRARKGMVLIDSSDELLCYSSFTASFASSQLAREDSPPLILGGHATVYVNSIRAAVKIILVALDERDKRPGSGNPSPLPPGEVFHFDTDDEDDNRDAELSQDGNFNGSEVDGRVKISFRFVSTLERMDVGDQVFVVPTVTAPGPVAGPAVANTSGVAGFVGTVCEAQR